MVGVRLAVSVWGWKGVGVVEAVSVRVGMVDGTNARVGIGSSWELNSTGSTQPARIQLNRTRNGTVNLRKDAPCSKNTGKIPLAT
jgi:hypothetical protein